MQRRFLIAAAGLTAVFPSFASPAESPQPLKVDFASDESRGLVIAKSEEFDFSAVSAAGVWSFRSVFAANAKTVESLHQVHAAVQYEQADWRHYSSAIDADGQAVVLTQLGTAAGLMCSSARTEEFALSFSWDYLFDHAGNGIRVTCSGKNGNAPVVLNISADRIQAWLKAVSDKELANRIRHDEQFPKNPKRVTQQFRSRLETVKAY